MSSMMGAGEKEFRGKVINENTIQSQTGEIKIVPPIKYNAGTEAVVREYGNGEVRVTQRIDD